MTTIIKNCKGFLLDTDFLIDLNRSRRNVQRKKAEVLLTQINIYNLFVTNVTATEFFSGISADKIVDARRMLLQLYNYVAPTAEEAIFAGQLRREWLSRGHTLAVSDVTNAAVAITRDLVIVTRNAIHYPFEQLILTGW